MDCTENTASNSYSIVVCYTAIIAVPALSKYATLLFVEVNMLQWETKTGEEISKPVCVQQYSCCIKDVVCVTVCFFPESQLLYE
jgi:hypothetical protein